MEVIHQPSSKPINNLELTVKHRYVISIHAVDVYSVLNDGKARWGIKNATSDDVATIVINSSDNTLIALGDGMVPTAAHLGPARHSMPTLPPFPEMHGHECGKYQHQSSCYGLLVICKVLRLILSADCSVPSLQQLATACHRGS